MIPLLPHPTWNLCPKKQHRWDSTCYCIYKGINKCGTPTRGRMDIPGLGAFEGLSVPFPANPRRVPLPSRSSPPSAAGGRRTRDTPSSHTYLWLFCAVNLPVSGAGPQIPWLGLFLLPLWVEERKRGERQGQSMGEGGGSFPCNIHSWHVGVNSHLKSILIIFLTKIHFQIILSFKY